MNASEIHPGCSYWITHQGEEVQITTVKRAMSVAEGWVCNREPKSNWIIIQARFFLRPAVSPA